MITVDVVAVIVIVVFVVVVIVIVVFVVVALVFEKNVTRKLDLQTSFQNKTAQTPDIRLRTTTILSKTSLKI